MRILSASVEETRALAGKLGRAIRCHLEEAPSRDLSLLLGLSGELGAGKTAFAQGFVAGFAPDRELDVTSPTFAIVQTYATEPPVTHIDLYRIGSLEELEEIGYRDHYYAPGVTLVEWISRVPEAIPTEWIEISLAVLASGVREIRVEPHGDRPGVVVSRALGGRESGDRG